MATLAILHDGATPMLRRLRSKFDSPADEVRLLMSWGARIRREAQRRAIAKGGRRFWREIARSIMLVPKSRMVTVEARHRAAAQKQYGGVIRAKGKGGGGADALTIPISPESEGLRAANFTAAGLKLFRVGNALGYSKDGQFQPLFALVRQTKPQRPDPFFPDEDEMVDIGEQETMRVLARK
jgi:hypothetical protein